MTTKNRKKLLRRKAPAVERPTKKATIKLEVWFAGWMNWHRHATLGWLANKEPPWNGEELLIAWRDLQRFVANHNCDSAMEIFRDFFDLFDVDELRKLAAELRVPVRSDAERTVIAGALASSPLRGRILPLPKSIASIYKKLKARKL